MDHGAPGNEVASLIVIGRVHGSESIGWRHNHKGSIPTVLHIHAWSEPKDGCGSRKHTLLVRDNCYSPIPSGIHVSFKNRDTGVKSRAAGGVFHIFHDAEKSSSAEVRDVSGSSHHDHSCPNSEWPKFPI